MSTMVETPREQEQVTGTLTGIIQKGPDKWQAVVQVDNSQYTRNLWTKDAVLVTTLSALIGQRMAFLCNISNWAMADGTPVRSLWIEATGPSAVGSPALAGPAQPSNWEAAQAAQQAAAPVMAPQPQVVAQPAAVTVTQQVSGDVKEQRIHRQTASKVAAIMLTHVQPEERTMTTLLILAERLVAYYNDGLPQIAPVTLDDLITQAMPASMEGAPMFADVREGPPPEDDIPF